MEDSIRLRHAEKEDWDEISALIFHSTNAWYQANRGHDIFTGEPAATRLFCEVYEDLDPGRCVLAVDEETSRIAGSCFYHPRETHVSLGIMNAHPDFAGRGVARRLLAYILDFARGESKDVRLVSSAMNLDSFSLYNRAGFKPFAVYQDMILDVPAEGIRIDCPQAKRVRDARLEDVPAMVELEHEVAGLRRGSDFEYFIRNEKGYWHMSVIEGEEGRLDGFLASICHPASSLLGPGCMRSDQDAIALIQTELDVRKGKTMVWLVPSDRGEIVQAMYRLKAKNCELHLGQSTGEVAPVKGISMPTFMPETA
ncbi:GNAT family N-acetyltransferase [Pelagicoccus mobilis]|uniref:GNAT family N-acetyltransferase n=1 Tax=Pelagicoccus mobilis TaxID=415221 RepID=A0A934RZQ5_9BACT|nr:GNAT family N-acetyltransferase [Pelagicoccus mobilis]MBK1877272.1 GNAT family N-acetyltransferase [Pelagicoccus mobilis]